MRQRKKEREGVCEQKRMRVRQIEMESEKKGRGTCDTVGEKQMREEKNDGEKRKILPPHVPTNTCRM